MRSISVKEMFRRKTNPKDLQTDFCRKSGFGIGRKHESRVNDQYDTVQQLDLKQARILRQLV